MRRTRIQGIIPESLPHVLVGRYTSTLVAMLQRNYPVCLMCPTHKDTETYRTV